jgi:hypothetical protein
MYKKKNHEPTEGKCKRADYKTSTTKARSKEEQCLFSFTIFLMDDSSDVFPGRWFLSALPSTRQQQCNVHRNHYQLEPSNMHIPIQIMTEAEKRLASDCSQLYFTASNTAALLSLQRETKLNWKPSQLAYLSAKERAAVSKLSSDATTAEKLVESFQSRQVHCPSVASKLKSNVMCTLRLTSLLLLLPQV